MTYTDEELLDALRAFADGAGRASDRMTEELVEILSTRVVDVEYEISTDVSVR